MRGGQQDSGFIFEAPAARIVFGPGRVADLADEATALGSRVFLVAGRSHAAVAEQLKEQLGDALVGSFEELQQHVPWALAERATQAARHADAEVVVSIGGGTATGFAKAIALQLDTPIVAAPTTFAGSEMTPIWGCTVDGAKRTGRDPRVLPRTVVCDPELTVGLPPATTATSAFNAIAHAVEAFYAPAANPITEVMAAEGLRALVTALPRAVGDPAAVGDRAQCAYGALLAARSLAVAGASAHHKLCHVLGGRHDLPHAELHTVLLPHVLRRARSHVPDAVRRLGEALGADDAVAVLEELQRCTEVPRSLGELGMPASDVEETARIAEGALASSGVPLELEEISELLRDAHAGDGLRPAAP